MYPPLPLQGYPLPAPATAPLQLFFSSWPQSVLPRVLSWIPINLLPAPLYGVPPDDKSAPDPFPLEHLFNNTLELSRWSKPFIDFSMRPWYPEKVPLHSSGLLLLIFLAYRPCSAAVGHAWKYCDHPEFPLLFWAYRGSINIIKLEECTLYSVISSVWPLIDISYPRNRNLSAFYMVYICFYLQHLLSYIWVS